MTLLDTSCFDSDFYENDEYIDDNRDRNIKHFEGYRFCNEAEGRHIPLFFLYLEFLIYRCVCNIFTFFGMPNAL